MNKGFINFKKIIMNYEADKLTDTQINQLKKMSREIADPTTIKEWLKTSPEIDGCLTSAVYEVYSDWCKEGGLKPCSKNMLSRQLTIYGFESKVCTVKGKSVRKYI